MDRHLRVTITSTRYLTFPFSLAWFRAICNGLPRVAIKFLKKLLIFLKKLTPGNPLQIAQNQANLRENIR